MRAANQDFTLNGWIVKPDQCRIERGDEVRRVKPKSMEVLLCLVAGDGRVVSRKELFDAIWPGVAVTDDVLTHCVVDLRKAFGDSARDPQVIETIPRKGFRIVTGPTPAEEDPVAPGRPRLVHAFLPGIVALFLLSIIVSGYLGNDFAADVVDGSDVPVSIAVLPFVDMSPSGDAEYFADGLAEELINRLTQLDGLQVTGRTSSFYFKGRNEDLRSIGDKLSVNHVLEGSVRKADDRLRITAQLVAVDSGFHLWSRTYDRQFEEVLAIQDEIAAAVADALSIRLSVGQLGKIKGGTTNVAAFDEVMLGNALHHEFTADSMLQAIRHYRRATELDPAFALAWERLANVYRTAWLTFGDHESDEWDRLADDAIGHALTVAPDSQYVLQTAAYIEIDRQNWTLARRRFDQMLALRPPADPEKSMAYTDMLTKTGHIDAALRLQNGLRRLDPLHPSKSMYISHLYLSDGRIEEALTQLEHGYTLDGFHSQTSVGGVVAALAARDSEEIRKWLRRALLHQQPGARGIHEAMLERLDDREMALQWLRSAYASRSISDYYVIIWASYYRDDELALQAMQRSPDLWAFWTPLTAHLRVTNEFRKIIEDIGLVAYWDKYGWSDYCRRTSPTEFECQ